MKLAILGDLHFGNKNDDVNHLNYQLSYLQQVIDYLKSNEIDTIIQLGDFFHPRKEINVRTNHYVKEKFLNILEKEKIKMYILSGNHDQYYTQKNEISSLSFIEKYKNIFIIEKIQSIDFDGKECLFVPWLANDEDKKLFEQSLKTTAKICFGHFEFKDFLMVPGHIQEKGLDKNTCIGFEYVFSGHYHIKQVQENIIYTGTPFELSWNDYNIEKGFYVLDTKTNKLQFEKNPHTLHTKIYYDEDKVEEYNVTGKIIKIFVTNKKDETKFEEFIQSIEKQNPESFVIIDLDNTINTDEITFEDVNVLEMIKHYIKEKHEDSKVLKEIMTKLYQETLND